MKLNRSLQFYKGLPLRLVDGRDYKHLKAKRYLINDTNQNVWIPNRHLEENGIIKHGENLDYIFVQSSRQLKLAGYELCFKPIQKQSTKEE